MYTVKIENVSKSYRKFQALHHIDLQIEKGLYGLLGPNGAGKSTLMNIISTILTWDEGRISVYGYDLKKDSHKVRELLGYLPQHFQAPGQFTGEEFLHYVASMKGMNNRQKRTIEVQRLLEQVNLTEHTHKKIKGYSGGMKRRLGIAQALIGQPKLIILDEPTAGLDPSERIRFRNVMERLGKEYTIILSTHILSDIETSCEHVGVINKGELLYQGETEKLASLAEGTVWEISVPISHYDEVEQAYTVLSSRREQEQMVFHVLSKAEPKHRATCVKPTLEDGYMALINGVIT
ncbi:ABC transporter ATP-binding protein [Oceanobacillus neutriphilus]|uniref:ABC transporter ATP-binding protein n=1 Tax=Oceanobacillus neutriphilus TaxID=531815 RepID=A0ABQ2NUB8_9BACI|nr:ABC transporter ATP-binding protein [Oceanobacillus neutriphilus]GGP10777.1 ABC transporter ATP-binding protein [Oceanobacillus neutriphilus]